MIGDTSGQEREPPDAICLSVRVDLKTVPQQYDQTFWQRTFSSTSYFRYESWLCWHVISYPYRRTL